MPITRHSVAQRHAYASRPHILRQENFLGIRQKDQPKHDIYEARPYPKAFWQKDWLTLTTGITGYYNLGKKHGFGIGFNPVNYGTIWPIFDRASWAMWI